MESTEKEGISIQKNGLIRSQEVRNVFWRGSERQRKDVTAGILVRKATHLRKVSEIENSYVKSRVVKFKSML